MNRRYQLTDVSGGVPEHRRGQQHRYGRIRAGKLNDNGKARPYHTDGDTGRKSGYERYDHDERQNRDAGVLELHTHQLYDIAAVGKRCFHHVLRDSGFRI